MINYFIRACMEVLAAKNALVIEFQEELNSKNDVYVKMLLQQGEDINELLSKMHKVAQFFLYVILFSNMPYFKKHMKMKKQESNQHF